MRKFFKLSICIYSSIALCLSCTKKTAQDKESIYVAIESAPKTLDPRFATDANGQRMTNLIFQSFVRLGPEMNIIGEAATHWSLNSKKLELKVPKKIFFSDGKALSKEDILFSFDEYQKESNLFSSSFKSIESVDVEEKLEEFLIHVKLNKSAATLLTDMTNLKILPKHIVGSMGVDFSRNLIGSGRYMFVRKEHNNYIFTSNPYFQGEKPHTKNLIFKVVKDDNTRFLKLVKGSVDLASNALSPQSTIKLMNNPNFKAHKSSGLSMNYLLINLRNPSLADINFRKAIAHAIDRESIINYKLEGLGIPASSILTPGNPYFHSELNAPEYNLEKAKEYFNKLKPRPTSLSIKTSNSPSVVENARVLANQIEKLGIEVKVESFEWGTFYGDIRNGNYQIASMRWVGATDPDIYRIAFHSAELPPGRNRGFYVNPKLDKFLDAGQSILDDKLRIENYKRVQEIVINDLPSIPLWYGTQVDIVNKSIKNFKPSLTGDFSYFYLLEK